MRKVKVYRPRRGMRFTFGRRGISPAAGFVGGGIPIEPVTLLGEVERSVEQNDSDVGDVISGSVSYGQVRPSGLYNRILLGTGIAGTGRPYSTVMTPVTAAIPSWTNSAIANQAFVGQSLFATGSNELRLNYYRSGSQAVENSAVPASATLFYSKQAKLQTLIVKKTASFFDTVVPFSGVIVPSTFLSNTGSYVTKVTGSNTPELSCSYRYPATIRIDVPVSGKLVDIKVWVELIQLSGTEFVGTLGRFYPLGALGIALRSPNVRWGHAHPIRNDKAIQDAVQDPTLAQYLAGSGLSNSDIWYPPANFYRDSFLLWEGIGICNDGMSGPASQGSQGEKLSRYPSWQRDRGMRTIFADGASTPNPRQLYLVATRQSYNGVVNKTNPYTHPSGNNWLGSPNANGILSENPTKVPTPVHDAAQWAVFEVGVSAFGNSWPWTSDKTVFPATESHQAIGSPPPGWLTGPGGAANTNEWPTTGVNWGAESIKPLYPLLENIYQKKIVGDEVPIIGSIVKFIGSDFAVPQSSPGTWRGFRPGLRGTQISGTWELLICQSGRTAELNGSSHERNVDTYFRQVRLELTYESNMGPMSVRRGAKTSARRAVAMQVGRISGSASPTRDDLSGSWDSYISENYLDVPQEAEVGRTFGVQLNTGSFIQSNFALIYRLTGTLADHSGSAPGWLLNNQFGMPAIPESSASLVAYDPYVAPVIGSVQGIIVPSKILDGPKNLADLAADLNPPLSLAQMASAFVSSSSR